MSRNIEEFMYRLIGVSALKFGPGTRTMGLTKHIEKEVEEVRADPTDLEEWIDLMILSLDGYWRHGGEVYMLLERLYDKLEVVAQREYPQAVDDQPCEHYR